MFLERDQCITQILQAIGWIINAETETNKEIHFIAVKLVSLKYFYCLSERNLRSFDQEGRYLAVDNAARHDLDGALQPCLSS